METSERCGGYSISRRHQPRLRWPSSPAACSAPTSMTCTDGPSAEGSASGPAQAARPRRVRPGSAFRARPRWVPRPASRLSSSRRRGRRWRRRACGSAACCSPLVPSLAAAGSLPSPVRGATRCAHCSGSLRQLGLVAEAGQRLLGIRRLLRLADAPAPRRTVRAPGAATGGGHRGGHGGGGGAAGHRGRALRRRGPRPAGHRTRPRRRRHRLPHRRPVRRSAPALPAAARARTGACCCSSLPSLSVNSSARNLPPRPRRRRRRRPPRSRSPCAAAGCSSASSGASASTASASNSSGGRSSGSSSMIGAAASARGCDLFAGIELLDAIQAVFRRRQLVVGLQVDAHAAPLLHLLDRRGACG